MINILSYVGMNMQAEVCLWTLLGLMRTIFDATLFKVNANLKQVWQMSMPEELSMPVQRVLRTMISGIMLVQCFTVYVYLAAYIVLLYPVFLEERPTLVLPWLLLAAIRKLLCELTSLALGLGTCVLLGTAKPPCIRFLVSKIITIMPAFYMWMLVYSYYHALKVATAFKTFPVVIPPNGLDYGLELAVRRRCTKSLFGEEQLRKKLVAGFYAEHTDITKTIPLKPASQSDSSCDEVLDSDTTRLSVVSHKYAADIGAYEDWFGSEIFIPRGDRILEQFVVMLLRIGAYLNKNSAESIKTQMFYSAVTATWPTRENIDAIPADITETPPLVGSSKGNTASYVREYPHIFMKKLGSEATQSAGKTSQAGVKNAPNTAVKSHQYPLSNKSYKHNDTTLLDAKRNLSDRTLSVCKTKSSQISVNNYLLPTLEETNQDSIMSAEDVITDKKIFEKKELDESMLRKSDYATAALLLSTSKDMEQRSPSINKQTDKTELPNTVLEAVRSEHSKLEPLEISPPELQFIELFKVTSGLESKEPLKGALVTQSVTETNATFSDQEHINNLLQNGNVQHQEHHQPSTSHEINLTFSDQEQKSNLLQNGNVQNQEHNQPSTSHENTSTSKSSRNPDSSSPDRGEQKRKKEN